MSWRVRAPQLLCVLNYREALPVRCPSKAFRMCKLCTFNSVMFCASSVGRAQSVKRLCPSLNVGGVVSESNERKKMSRCSKLVVVAANCELPLF